MRRWDVVGKTARYLRRKPVLTLEGVVVIVLGTVADTVAHVVHPDVQAGFTAAQQTAHLAILLGMVVTLVGVVVDGQHRGRHLRRVADSKEVPRVSRHR